MILATCHCGAISIGVPTTPEKAVDCNCSICRRYGALWAYFHSSDVYFLNGADDTESYRRGDGLLEFHRCKTCGCTTHWQSTEPAADRMAINARLFAPEVLAKTPIRKFDGADTWKYLDT